MMMTIQFALIMTFVYCNIILWIVDMIYKTIFSGWDSDLFYDLFYSDCKLDQIKNIF